MPDIFNDDRYAANANSRFYSNNDDRPIGVPGGSAGTQAGGSFSVSEINRYLNAMMKSDEILQNVWVHGEVSNYKPHYSGHMYFTLKDSMCALRCVMFRGAASQLRFRLENGLKVRIRGGISVFERDGQYQLYCEEIHAEGAGDLYTAYEQIKKRLADEGLFDSARKKPLPSPPRAICVITSPTGSVVRDIINVSTRRFPQAVLKIYPVQVQGAAAAPQIIRAIGRVNETKIADVIIVARGGGSIEDLWAFNEESLARAVAASGIPVVSAIGHETDFTICDFTADLRAPTPSAAAELTFPDAAALTARITHYTKQLRSALLKKYERAKSRYGRCRSSVVFTKPANRVEYARMRLIGGEEKLVAAMRARNERNFARTAMLTARLNALSPLSTLARGYAVVTDVGDGKIIRNSNAVEVGQRVAVKLSEGGLLCEVIEATK